jgi:ABC-type amino acid transport substrate-binding protein
MTRREQALSLLLEEKVQIDAAITALQSGQIDAAISALQSETPAKPARTRARKQAQEDTALAAEG